MTNDPNPQAETLWALHIIGPDEVYPAPTRELAEQAVELFNAWYARQPKGDGYPEMSAAVIEWPYGPLSHATEAPYFVENFITPRGELAPRTNTEESTDER